MLRAACNNGWLDFGQAAQETLLSIRRAGADVILTYFAKDFAMQFPGESDRCAKRLLRIFPRGRKRFFFRHFSSFYLWPIAFN